MGGGLTEGMVEDTVRKRTVFVAFAVTGFRRCIVVINFSYFLKKRQVQNNFKSS